MSRPPFWFVFDVESVGLHGEGFAVGGIVLDADGAEVEEFLFHCSPGAATGASQDRAWVEQNVSIAEPTTAQSPSQVRSQLWSKWAEWEAKGAWMAADVPWPVEAHFLEACLMDAWQRTGVQIYPLIDVASMRLARGKNPLAAAKRRENELPAHHPTKDARQSARLLMEALKRASD